MRTNHVAGCASATVLPAILSLAVLGSVFLATSACGASSNSVDHVAQPAPPVLTRAVGCLVAAEFVRKYDLGYLGLKVGDWASAKYTVGSISGTGKTPDLVNITIYTANESRGVLLFAYPNKRGGFDAILNAYRFEKRGENWQAGYGNGGYVVYEAIAKYVTQLEKQPSYRVHLTPGGGNCGILQ